MIYVLAVGVVLAVDHIARGESSVVSRVVEKVKDLLS